MMYCISLARAGPGAVRNLYFSGGLECDLGILGESRQAARGLFEALGRGGDGGVDAAPGTHTLWDDDGHRAGGERVLARRWRQEPRRGPPGRQKLVSYAAAAGAGTANGF
jgi:hypothetical protein